MSKPSPLGVVAREVWEDRVKTERIDSLLSAAKRSEEHYRALRSDCPRNHEAEALALFAVARFATEAGELARSLAKPEVPGE